MNIIIHNSIYRWWQDPPCMASQSFIQLSFPRRRALSDKSFVDKLLKPRLRGGKVEAPTYEKIVLHGLHLQVHINIPNCVVYINSIYYLWYIYILCILHKMYKCVGIYYIWLRLQHAITWLPANTHREIRTKRCFTKSSQYGITNFSARQWKPSEPSFLPQSQPWWPHPIKLSPNQYPQVQETFLKSETTPSLIWYGMVLFSKGAHSKMHIHWVIKSLENLVCSR